jgi:F420 biosynthesis protein FbiB-like protein
MDVAINAPSAHNNQAWHFIVITTAELIYRLAKKMSEKYDQDMIAQKVPANTRKKRIQRSLDTIGKAPAIVIPFLTNDRKREKGQTASEALEGILDMQSTALALGHVLLAVTAAGLGACWYAAPLFCPEIVNQQLNVDIRWKPQALITIGYPDESPELKKKRSLSDMVTYL